MKNKKNIAMAMAAVSSFGVVAPAFANEVQTVAFDQNYIDVMLASGYKTNGVVYKRTDIYNTNGTKDRKDDTLKNAFKDAKIVVSKENKDDSYLDQFVLATKVTDVTSVNEAKSYVESARTLINEAKEAGATVKVENKAAEITTAGVYIQSMVTVTVTPKKVTEENPVKIYKFVGAEGIVSDEKPETPVTATDLLKIFTDLNSKLNTDVVDAKIELDLKSTNYDDINLIKYTIEKNIEKFDIVKEENATSNNEDLDVTLYVKGSKQIDSNKVITIKFKNFTKVDKDLIINMPKLESSDFKGHWAQNEILNAMLAGDIDASSKFRPQASITRAEFAKIACTVFDIKVSEDKYEPFHDVANGTWYQKYVAALYNEKVSVGDKKESVIQGDGQSFRPNDSITRQEVAVILAKLSQKKLDTKEVLDVATEKIIGYDENRKPIKAMIHEDVYTKFMDDKDIDTWADNSVKYLNEKVESNGKPVVQGSSNKFNPKNNITRAEALVMVQRAEYAKVVTGK